MILDPWAICPLILPLPHLFYILHMWPFFY